MNLTAEALGVWTAVARAAAPDPPAVPLAVREVVATLVEAGQWVLEARRIAAGRSADEQVGVEAATQFYLEIHGLPFDLFGCPELPAAAPCPFTAQAVLDRLMDLRLPDPVRH